MCRCCKGEEGVDGVSTCGCGCVHVASAKQGTPYTRTLAKRLATPLSACRPACLLPSNHTQHLNQSTKANLINWFRCWGLVGREGGRQVVGQKASAVG